MRAVTVILVCLAVEAGSVSAQIPIPTPQMPAPSTGDTTRAPVFRYDPPVSPLGALWRSMLIPGWGQAILGRRVTGAAFVFWEGIAVTMTLKAIHQRGYLERTGSNNVEAKNQEVEDWAVLLAFNHLLAGAEAFVAAVFWDFPGELETGVTEDGDVRVGVSYNFR